jgi:hypothetical protein
MSNILMTQGNHNISILFNKVDDKHDIYELGEKSDIKFDLAAFQYAISLIWLFYSLESSTTCT